MAPRLDLEAAQLPPLPTFNSEELRTQVFTHRSYYGRPNHIFEDHPDDPAPDNEKLEHLGDTVLSLVVTTMMTEMFPTLRVGPSTKVRALVVGNATLADISVRYKLTEQLRLHSAQAVTLKTSPNVQADVFEAFVGGLYQDQGLEVVQRWLTELLRPYAVAAYRLVRSQHGLTPTPATPTSPSDKGHDSSPVSPYGYVNPEMSMTTIGHLALFNQHLQKSNQAVEWVYSASHPELDPAAQSGAQLISPNMIKGIKSTPIWVVRVMVDGKCLGQGRGGTKKVARNEAAKLGLQNLGIHVYPDLYFKCAIGFAGPRFPQASWGLWLANSNQGNSAHTSNIDNSRHDFSRLWPEAALRGSLPTISTPERCVACLSVKRSWVENARTRFYQRNNLLFIKLSRILFGK